MQNCRRWQLWVRRENLSERLTREIRFESEAIKTGTGVRNTKNVYKSIIR